MPQLAQNFAPAATSAWHLEQAFVPRPVPQLEQNFAPGAFTVWHFGQAAAEGIPFPQLEQNFVPGAMALRQRGQAFVVAELIEHHSWRRATSHAEKHA